MPRSPETPRFKRILKKAERIGAAGLAATSLTTGIDAAISSVSAKAPEAVVASPSKSFKLETPQDVLKSVQAELATKDKKPKGDKKNGEEAQGVTTTTRKEQLETMEKQIEKVAVNIARDHALSQEQLLTWFASGNQFTIDSAGEGINFDNPTVFDGDTAVDPVRNLLLYHFGSPQVKEVSPQPNLTLLTGTPSYRGTPESQMYDTLVLYDGYVEAPLSQSKSGKALVSFGTQIWPNGERITLAWINAIQDPDDTRLQDPRVSILSQTPAYVTDFDKKRLGFFNTQPGDFTNVSYEELKDVLKENRGKPVEATFLGNYWASNPNAPIFGYKDVTIGGVSFYSVFSSHWGITEAWMNQDQGAFTLALQNAAASGVAISTLSDKANYEQSVKNILGPLTSVDEAFKHLPLGINSVIKNSTSPHATATSAAHKKA